MNENKQKRPFFVVEQYLSTAISWPINIFTQQHFLRSIFCILWPPIEDVLETNRAINFHRTDHQSGPFSISFKKDFKASCKT